MGVPIVAIMVPITWLYLTRFAFRVPAAGAGGDVARLDAELAALGPMRAPERRVLAVFATTVALWIFRADLDVGLFVVPGWSHLLANPAAVDDTVVAVAMATLLFLLPSGEPGTSLLGDDWAGRIPWSVLVLLGGGFALAAGVEASGLALWLANRLGDLRGLSVLTLVLIVTALLTFLTEFTVNSAVTALMMPILAATATGIGVDPRLLMIPATLAASYGFMMPGGTAPNAIVFASGRLTVPQMARAGLGLDLIGVVVVAVVFYLIGIPVFGIAIGEPPPWVR